MSLKGLDISVLTKLTSQQKDNVSCLECCRYYVAPASAACGHTLCNGCWHGRRNCPTCASPVQKKNLQLNLPLQNLTEHVQVLIEAFEKLFNIKLDELALDVPNIEGQEDPNKNVKDWLANSQNHFSAPVSSQSTQDLNPPVEYLTTKVQIHSTNVKIKSPIKVTHVPIPQDNWDKISKIEDGVAKDQLDIIEQMQIEPFAKDDTGYSTNNPRRSIRNRESTNNSITEPNDIQNENISTKTSTIVSIKPSKKMKQTWNNVKKMKKEFSKLNKKSRNKLNVSIEMCKKTQTSNNNAKQLDKEKLTPDIIEDYTPNILETDKEIEQPPPKEQLNTKDILQKQLDPKATLCMDLNEEAVQENNKIVHSELAHMKSPLITENKDDSPINTENKNIVEKTKVKFFKKATLQSNTKENVQTSDNKNIITTNDDIQISIKIGNTITNICIKKKENNDVQVKVNRDREIQTSLGTQNVPENYITTVNSNPVNSQNIEINFGESGPVYKSTQTKTQSVNKAMLDRVEHKSILSKKTTASADTRTAQFEITESVEKELSDIMECVENGTVNNSRKSQTKKPSKESEQLQGSSQKENIPEDIEVNDVDIFDGELSSAPTVQSLKSAKNVSSRILVPSQNKNSKRKFIENIDECLNTSNNSPRIKKAKISGKEHNLDVELENSKVHINSKLSINDSECQNYDVVMDKVFANIDKDIKTIHKDVNISKANIEREYIPKTQGGIKKRQDENDQKYSENIFSILDTDDSQINSKKNTQSIKPALESLTPTLCQELRSVHDEGKETGDAEMMELCTPFQENYDSDKSVVEETPQKNVSIPKVKQRSGASFQVDSNINRVPQTTNTNNKQSVKSVVNITDSVTDSTRITIENTVIKAGSRPTLETPLNINKFVDQIKHNSTPVARKSLNFNRQNDEDNDQTLCPSSIAAVKTTQEKEFLNEVFDQSGGSQMYKKTMPIINRLRPNKLCIAGSCLTAKELAKLKFFCKQRGWTYMEKYTKELTHLVVGVDDEKKSQRSVKYMCALAAGKWIISFAWVETCLQSQMVLPEEPFETLDSTGEPGPKRSRLAKRKLFEGITFHCMEPFSMLDVITLKDILESAGGRVVDDAKEVRVKDDKPAILLAEPEHTQEDRFTYIAMDLEVVPVNYEWVLNCLGNYTLGSILELLLCPYSLLPPVTNSWPAELFARDFD